MERDEGPSLWIMIAGPYRSGSSDPSVWAENLRKLNLAANAIFQKGHVPIIGVNMALPVIDAAGQELYEKIMMPLSLRLTDRCDAVLRIEGISRGADEEVDRFRARGLRVFRSIDEIPDAHPGSRMRGDFWRRISLEELARQQGVQPVERIEDLLGGWPEDQIDDGF